MNPVEIRRQGLEALVKTLGFVGMVRFIHQFDSGSGDYTKEREQWLGNLTFQDVIEEIQRQRQSSKS